MILPARALWHCNSRIFFSGGVSDQVEWIILDER